MADAVPRVNVPVAEVAVEAYRAVFGRLGLVLELSWLPLLVMLAAALIPGYLHFYLGWLALPAWRGDDVGLTAEAVVEALAGLACLNAFAVRWHQAMLFAGERQPPVGTFARAWTRFVIYTLVIYLVSAAVMAMLVIADSTGAGLYLMPLAAALAALLWIGMVRCSLLLPAAAFGRPLGIGAAWRTMRGNAWRLVGCGFVTCTPVLLIVILILSGIFTALQLDQLGGRLPLGFFILRGVIATCANFVVVALGASILSAFYRRIVLRGLGVF